MALPEIPYDEWFHKPHPHDTMPIATDVGEWLPENGDEPPRPEEEIADDFSIHEKMYKIATSKYNPFSVGGSENIHDFDRKD